MLTILFTICAAPSVDNFCNLIVASAVKASYGTCHQGALSSTHLEHEVVILCLGIHWGQPVLAGVLEAVNAVPCEGQAHFTEVLRGFLESLDDPLFLEILGLELLSQLHHLLRRGRLVHPVPHHHGQILGMTLFQKLDPSLQTVVLRLNFVHVCSQTAMFF